MVNATGFTILDFYNNEMYFVYGKFNKHLFHNSKSDILFPFVMS